MNQIPNIEEVESPLYALKNRIKWDYSYYISREESANGYWKRVDSIDQVPLHAARTHRTHPVEEPDNLFLYKIYQYLLAHHQQLQKVREEEVRLFMTTMQDRANTIRPNLLLNEIVNYAHDRLKVLNHSELDQDPVHDFFTAPEEVKRPVYERALAKTQEEQEKKLDQPTVKCGHHQAMLEGAAVGLDQDGKCIDCGAEVLRTDTNK